MQRESFARTTSSNNRHEPAEEFRKDQERCQRHPTGRDGGMLQAINRLVLALALLVPAATLAQTPSTTSPPSSSGQLLNPQQLQALVAPIALYPDNLLAEV